MKLSVSYEASCQQCNNMQFMSSPPVFRGVRVTRFLVLCVWFVDRYSSIYGFWLPLWYLQTLLMYMLIRYFGSKCFLSRFLRCSLVASIITRDFRSANVMVAIMNYHRWPNIYSYLSTCTSLWLFTSRSQSLETRWVSNGVHDAFILVFSCVPYAYLWLVFVHVFV